ncbi:MAG: lamin tail domain-containing protein [Opitutales bacterium]|nr:lamin tail domain-containing protein [Opitutales bacterium]
MFLFIREFLLSLSRAIIGNELSATRRGIAAACVCILFAGVSQAQVVISEFMAKNDETLIDGDGNYSDWIELYNTGSTTVDLTGWYLSDDALDLTQWTFPSKSIAAGEFLIVFASGQTTAGYTDGGGYLHTNFKLSGSGESVVLTQSNGTTVEHSFIDYPEQDDDVSYGLAQDSSYTSLIVEEQSATALVGTSEPSSSWNTVSFDDSSWQSGDTGVGYVDIGPQGQGSDSPYLSIINLDVGDTMFVDGQPPSTYDSAYIRVDFTVSDPADISQLVLRMKYDDGFVAYINGVQVASANAPASLSYTSSATAEHDGSSYEDFTILNASSYLQSGSNVLAIHGLDYAVTGGPGVVFDFFIMPELTGVTVGEIQTNSAVYFETPTPDADNVFGILGYVDDTTFTVDRGFFSAAFDVEIACDTVGSDIYYTVDGTTPAADNGTLYSGAITISQTTVLRAAAFVTGYQPSDVDTQTYIFLDDIIAQGTNVTGLAPEFPTSAVNGQDFDYGMDTDITQSATYSSQIEAAMTAIPSISIVTDPDNLFDASTGIYVNASESGETWEREMSVELINPDGSDGFQINGGMRIRGASSTTSSNPKHSFRLIFNSEYGTSKLNYPLFGDEGADSFKRMDLRTGQNFSWANQTPQYATWLYDIFTRDSHRDMNQPYTRGEYYHLYINGMYWGLYQTEERCDSRYAASYYGGDNDDYDAVKADADSGDMYAVDGTRDAYEDLWTGITAGVTGNANYFALQGMNSDGTENSAGTKLLDVDNVIDYMLLIYFTGNRDSPVGPPIGTPTMPRNLTTIYSRTNPDGFKYVAHDNEHSLEVSQGVNHNRFNISLASSFDGIDRMTPWWMNLELMANDEYALRFADHVHEHFFNDGELTTARTTARMEARRDEIYAAVVAESARWGDSAGTLRTRDGDWESTVDWLLDTYMAQRSAIVLGQIQAKGWYPTVAAPEFNQHGGSIASGFSLSISGSGTVYYTTDGSDPREVGGAVSGTAYSSALTLDKSTQIKARVLSGGTWSALTKATFILNESSPLRVTEIMYHPAVAGSGAETGYSASDFEFIEILNTSAEAVGLAGTEFNGGVYFDFSSGSISTLNPGEYLVLVSNLDAFKARYTNWASINIAGEYTGKFYITPGTLDNSGEAVSLVDGFGNTILDFEYNDSWYAITDGEGYSLTLIDPTAATTTWSSSASWRASKYTGGTPGEAPEDFLSPDDIVINEALTHQDDDTPGDWIELYNNSDETIDINGWFLSDDNDNLMKIELSGLSTIAPGGYLVLTEASHFGTTVDAINGFALSELGEAIYLSSGESSELTGYRVINYFGAAERDVTFGRYVKSDGTADFTAQSSQTFGAANAYPLMGDVVITEVMYHPSDISGYEFIEIRNTGSSSVSLYDSTYTTNTWKLEGAVEFTFPVGLTLDPGEYLVISETDEASFRSYYTVDAGVTVLGPYTGSLNNSGEDIYLTRPGDPEALTGEVPYIVVELVDYDDASPWPTEADGAGYSLRRLDELTYPNDYVNWSRSSGLPTPGLGDDALISDYTEMTVAGTFNSWNASGANMTLVDNYTWEWENTFSSESSVEFKFAANGSWDANWGDSAPSSLSLPLSGIADWFGSNIVVSDTLNGTYRFTFNEQSLAYSLVVTGSADGDGDGMNDSWEEYYFVTIDAVNGGPSDDWDSDGSSNLSEYIAGTDPTDPADLFCVKLFSISGTSVDVSWSSVSGKTYAIQKCTDLTGNSWGSIVPGINATSPTNSYNLTSEDTEAFFRVIVE